MKNSFESTIQTDLLTPHQNGYDGLLTLMNLRLTPGSERLEAGIELQVVSIGDHRESWHRLSVTFTTVSFVRISEEWFVGGGCVLYNGGRLLVSRESEDIVLDLDPGVAWLTASGVRHTSSFLIEGKGSVTVSAASQVNDKWPLT